MRSPFVLVVVVLIGISVACSGGESTDEVGTTDTSAISEPTTTSTAPTSGTTTSTAPPVDQHAALAALPWASPDDAHQTPLDAVAAFIDFVGFVDETGGPLTAQDMAIGEFASGDQRSGEVEFRVPVPHDPSWPDSAPVTTVAVRQSGPNDTWWVLAAFTEVMAIDEPPPFEVWEDLRVTGTYFTMGGGATLRIYADGSDAPLLETCAPCGGGVWAQGDFSYDVSPENPSCLAFQNGDLVEPCEWQPPSGGSGTLVFTGGDGVATVPVVFADA